MSLMGRALVNLVNFELERVLLVRLFLPSAVLLRQMLTHTHTHTD